MKTSAYFRLLRVLPLLALLPVCPARGQANAASANADSLMRAPSVPAGSVDLGPVPAAQPMSVTLHLAPSAAQSAALLQFLSAVQTPGSGEYHAWLTPGQFGAQFGADAQEIAAVQSLAVANGIRLGDVVVSASGLRVTLTGTAAQMESALAPGMHRYQVGAKVAFANTAAPAVPAALAGDVLAIDGLNTLPSAHPLAMTVDGAASTADDPLAALTAAVEANTGWLVTLSSTACVEDFDAGTSTATQLVLRQAVAQGMTVLAASGCGSRGSAGFPSAMSEVTAVAVAPGITPAVNPTLTELRPEWQNAPGLPADAFRHEPDVTVASMTALAQTMTTILAEEPANSDGSAAKLGNVNATLYELAPMAGLYTQTDGAKTGTWEAATGLGQVDLAKLAKVFPHGTFGTNVQLTINNPGAVHGQNITFNADVTNTSGNNTLPTPTGTITFVTNTGVTVGSGTLTNGTFSATYNQLPANPNYTVTAQYSGDANYAANNSVTDSFSVTPEASEISAAVVSAVPVGGTITVNVSDTSASGVGTPSGTVQATQPGTPDTATHTATLSGSNGTATATVTLPAVQAGAIAVKVNCVSADPSFTCYNPINVTATVTTGVSHTTLTVSPNPPVSGQTTTFTATVTGAGNGFPTPTGNVNFSDNGVVLGAGTISGTTATFTDSNLSGSVSHNFTAMYSGDNNYASSTSNGTTTNPNATTTTLTVNPNPPVNGQTTTLTASIQYTSNGTAPTGSVAFYEDGAQIGSGTVSNGSASYSSTTLSGTTAHTFYAVYSGDGNYATSTSSTVNTAASGPSTTSGTLTVSPNPPVSGQTTTIVDTIHYTGSNSPTGTVTFYEDGGQIGTASVSGGTATFTSTTISGKTTHTFYAVYAGDSNFSGDTSNTATTGTSPASNTTTTLTVNPNPPVSGQTTTLTATVAYTTGATPPTGTVMFYEDGAQIGTGTVNGGVATYSSTTLSGSTGHSFYAVYGGDVNFNGSTSNTVTTQIATSTTTTTISATPTIVATGGTVQLTATVTPTTTINGTAPTGTVTFSSSTQGVLGSSALNGTTAVLSPTLTTVGTQSITATYGGNGSYSLSTSQTPATVTVGPATALTISVAPSANVQYGTPVTLSAGVTATPNNGSTTGPTGQVNFTLAGTVQLTASAALSPTSSTSASGSTTISAPTPGTYIVQATCTGYNFNCTNVNANQTQLVTVKANTTTTVTANPTTPVAGQAEQFTATVVNANTLASSTAAAPTGNVEFFINGTAAGSGTLVGNQATFSTTLPGATGNSVTAVYQGDSNYNTSTSAAITLTVAPVQTTATLTASPTNGLAGSLVVLTASISDTVTTTNANPGTPVGSVTFYDVYNGETVPLGTVPLTASGPYLGVAQFSTTGLMVGVHNISAVYGGTTGYLGSTTSVVVVSLTDFSVAFAPATLTLQQGTSGSSVATVTALNGFAGTVTLSCTAPAGSATTCSFNPGTITGSGTSLLTVATTAGTQAAVTRAATGVSLAALLLAVMLPGRKRRRPMLLAVLASCVLLGSLGCTNLVNANQTVQLGGGTPLGTEVLTIYVSGTDGKTTIRHDTQFQVTVQ